MLFVTERFSAYVMYISETIQFALDCYETVVHFSLLILMYGAATRNVLRHCQLLANRFWGISVT